MSDLTCICDTYPGTTDGPQRDCPVHGDMPEHAAARVSAFLEMLRAQAGSSVGWVSSLGQGFYAGGTTLYVSDLEALLDMAKHVTDVRQQIARDIWTDEQKCQTAMLSAMSGDWPDVDLRTTFLNGRLLGLQRARDIAEGKVTP